MGGTILSGCQARVCLEDSVEVVAAHADGTREITQIRQLLRLFDETTGPSDDGRLPFGEARPRRFTPLAGPEPRRLSLPASRVKPDVLAIRQPGRARGPTVDARRPHRIHEGPIRGHVASLHGLPSALIVGEDLFLPVAVGVRHGRPLRISAALSPLRCHGSAVPR
jgi:hypothetical protein